MIVSTRRYATKCTVCNHDEKDTIEKLLLDRIPFRVIAKKFNLSKDAVSRHNKQHFAPAMADPEGFAALNSGRTVGAAGNGGIHVDEVGDPLSNMKNMPISSNLAEHMLAIYKYAIDRLTMCREKEDGDISWRVLHIKWFREVRECLNMFLKAHEIVAINNSTKNEDLAELAGNVMEALREFPEARASVARKLNKEDA